LFFTSLSKVIAHGEALHVITHPVSASLDHPLFAFGGKRGLEKACHCEEEQRSKSLTQLSPKERALNVFKSLPLWGRFRGGLLPRCARNDKVLTLFPPKAKRGSTSAAMSG